jgi:hypothetical protein
MTDRRPQLRRAILSTSVAFVALHHGTRAKAILFERLRQLLHVHAQEAAPADLTESDDLGPVIAAASRLCGLCGERAATLGDPEFYLRTTIGGYFAKQSERLAANLGVAA